jgi:O-antigen ligase
MFGEFPITGVGLDNYQALSPKYVGVYAGKGEFKYIPGVKGRGFVTHSTWFQSLAEGGLLLSVPFFLMFPVAWAALSRVKRLRVPGEAGATLVEQALVLKGVMLAFIVSSSFGSHLKIDFMWWYFGAVAALQLIARKEALAAAVAARTSLEPPVRRLPVGAGT